MNQHDTTPYLPLVASIAGRIARGLPPGVDRRDLAQQGWFGLAEALTRADGGPRSASFIAMRIHGAIIDGLRSEDPLFCPLARRTGPAAVGGDPEVSPATEPSPMEQAAKAESARALRAAILAMTPHYRRVFRLRYWDDCGVADIAERLGITPGRVSQIHQAGLKILRRRLRAHAQ